MMLKRSELASLLLVLSSVACASSAPPAEGPPESSPVPAETANSETDPAPAGSASASETPAPEGGRLAYVQCEEPRKEMCTKEYRPVCADYDTGIRCIKEPCASSEKKQYGNGCSACADPKVSGYFPASCEELGSSKAP